MSEIASVYPLPTIEERDRPFWEGVQRGVLQVQKCLDCGQLQFFPRPVCVNCFSRNLSWLACKGTGKIYTFTLVNVPNDPAMWKSVQETKTPFILTIIELDEGVRILSEITDARPDVVGIGARVQVTFREVKGFDFRLPLFQIVNS